MTYFYDPPEGIFWELMENFITMEEVTGNLHICGRVYHLNEGTYSYNTNFVNLDHHFWNSRVKITKEKFTELLVMFNLQKL